MSETQAAKSPAEFQQEQAEYWNQRGGEKWVARRDLTDVMLAPISEALMVHARVPRGGVVLDIGCGCGATTLDLAERVRPHGHVIGVDISQPMINIAKERTAGQENIRLICADAGAYPFNPEADLIISRFGMMFFGAPTAAFKNLRGALKPEGRLVFVCWRGIDENPWMQTPLHTVYDAGIPRLPKPEPEAPGPFSFADPERVARIIREAGFGEAHFTPLDLPLDISAGRGLDGAIEQCLYIGASAHALTDQPPELREKAIVAIREALKPYVSGNHVTLRSASWIVEALHG